MTTGFPRPRQSGLPVPYVAREHDETALGQWDLAGLDDTRAHDCVINYLCQVCGERCADEMIVFTVHRGQYVETLDGGPLHERCARLAAVRCPNLANRPVVLAYRVRRNSLITVFVSGPDGPASHARSYDLVGERELVTELSRLPVPCNAPG